MKNSDPSVLNNNKSYELGRFFVSDTIIYWCTNMNLVVNMDNYISLLLTSHRVQTRNKATNMMSYGHISESLSNPATALVYPMAPR